MFKSQNGRLEPTKLGEFYLALLKIKEAIKGFIQKDPNYPRLLPKWIVRRFFNYKKVFWDL